MSMIFQAPTMIIWIKRPYFKKMEHEFNLICNWKKNKSFQMEGNLNILN
jgi:hypothetical protein